MCPPISSISRNPKNQDLDSCGRHLVRVIWSMLKNERDYELREAIPSKESGVRPLLLVFLDTRGVQSQ